MSSFVVCGLPIFLPLSRAFYIPLRTLARIIDNSISAKTPLISRNAFVIPWHKIHDMRNCVAHEYGSIDFEIVWFASTKSIPELQIFCENYLA